MPKTSRCRTRRSTSSFRSTARRSGAIRTNGSQKRRAMLEQLRIPCDTVVPEYVESGDDPVEHAAGKARSVDGGEQPVLGVDTIVVVGGDVLGKPHDASAAEAMLERLGGRTHEV